MAIGYNRANKALQSKISNCAFDCIQVIVRVGPTDKMFAWTEMRCHEILRNEVTMVHVTVYYGMEGD